MQMPKTKMGTGKKILFGVVIIIFIGIIANIGKDKKGNKDASTTTQTSNEPNQASETKSYPTIGQTLHTEYFDVTINKAGLSQRINTGNEFLDQKADAGNQYLIINTTFKNIDNESRMLTDGTVYITYNGKEYEFDKSETIMAEGWGLMLDQINPLISKTTNLVYKIPLEIKGPATYKPGRSDDEQRISLGELK